MSLKFTTAPATSVLIRNRAGRLGPVTFSLDASAPTATYWVQFHDVSALPATPGSSAFLSGPMKIAHTTGVDDGPFNYDFPGAACVKGFAIILSTTGPILTLAGAYLNLIEADGT